MTKEVIFFSDFNTDLLTRLANNDVSYPIIKCRNISTGNFYNNIINFNDIGSKNKISFIWFEPKSISLEFSKAISLKKADHGKAISEIDKFCEILIKFSSFFSCVFIPLLRTHLPQRSYGIIDFRENLGLSNLTMKMNLRLSENLKDHNNIFLINSDIWFQKETTFDQKMWFLAKCPYKNDILKSAIADLKIGIQSLSGNSKKVLITDLDDTLWGGTVGDDGWEQLNIGGHNALGEAYLEYQKTLLSLKEKGVILAISSKNSEKNVIEAFKKHPEIVLKLDDFASIKINWNEKSDNIIQISKELNLGIDSFVFIDDNPVECIKVRERLPGVFTPTIPEDKMLLPNLIKNLSCFDTVSVTTEDRKRSENYVINRKIKLNNNKLSAHEWLRELKLEVQAEIISNANSIRISQLLNKTNQMNLKTRRMSELELIKWESDKNNILWAFRVKDKFIDSGLTAIASFSYHDGIANIEDFVLSCRVMGKKVEETIIHYISKIAKDLGLEKLQFQYKETAKNEPILLFLKDTQLKKEQNNTFTWNLKSLYPKSQFVTIIENQL